MILRFLHNLLFYLYTLISFLVGLAITFCFAPFSRDKIKTFHIAAQLWSRLLIFFSRVKVTTQGLENLPHGQPMILVSNHQSAADIPILLAYLPVHFRFAVKKELFSIPLLGWYLRKADYFSVDRQVILSAYRILEDMTRILKSGGSVLIFPEGTRSWDGTLGKFKRGSLMAALDSGAPVIPVALSGSFNILPRRAKLFKPAKVKLSVGKPIYIRTEEEYDQKIEEARGAIAKML
jgi:1-acyl-sn-glycerol-3-phosphate acyltransferase